MDCLQLDCIIVFSRHGIRTPLPNTVDFLQTVTPKSWPTWDCAAGYLTTRGGTLESYFGDYFARRLAQQGTLLDAEDIFVYANSLQRTLATAQYFTLGAWAGQDIAIEHKYSIERMDEVFNPVVYQADTAFKQTVIDDLKRYTRSAQFIEELDQQLAPAYQLLSDILDYRQSAIYQQYQCEFAQLPTLFDLKQYQEPILLGPLALGTAIADAFTLQHYSGFAKHDIAWGMIHCDEQWRLITNIKNQYINLLYKSPMLAKHIAKPLVGLINQLFKTRQHKLNILVGHDSNIATLLAALGFDDYRLPQQFELTPIGGKVIFYRLYDAKTDQYYFNAEYLYPSVEQLHLASPLSLTNPPKHMTLTLSNIKPHENGLYLWRDVEQRIDDYLAGV
ncbi:glucose-1-phosphatase [Orbus hercynius]|uniref:Glucose-1-phosphatase n=1 Tax=Orbus hercynius TaxID=593135 RepID=A0A495RCG9_9GAMM|nr:histidine-type phosphatase [Orbus hercynius]RKS85162.1 glucose-1-phosphatase [Orbus hercynius]